MGDQLADFVIQNHIQGTLIQCMYFVPGTPVYEANRDRLLHQDWSKYNGNAVHFPRRMTPYQLQLEPSGPAGKSTPGGGSSPPWCGRTPSTSCSFWGNFSGT